MACVSRAEAQDTQAIAQLVTTLEGGDPRAAAASARALGVILNGAGDDEEAQGAVRALMVALESDDAPLREQSAVALGRIVNSEGLEALAEALDDEEPLVAQAAAQGLAAGLPLNEARTLLMAHADDGDSAALACYTAMAPLASAADADFFAQGLASENWEVQVQAVAGLQRAAAAGASLDKEVYEAATKLLDCEFLDGSQAAIDFFVAQGEVEAARETLVKAAEYVESTGPEGAAGGWRTRTNALKAISLLGWPATGEALEAAIRQLGDETTNVQNEAQAVLLSVVAERHVSESEMCERLLGELAAAENGKLQSGILIYLRGNVPAEFSERAAVAASATLAANMDDDDAWPVREDAILLLSSLGTAEGAAAIAACVNDEKPNVYQAAGETLIEIAPFCDEKTRLAVAEELAQVLASPRDWRNVTTAARAAGFFPSESRELLFALAEGLSSEILNVREACSQALATLASQGDEQANRVAVAVTREMARKQEAYEYGAAVLGATGSQRTLGLLTRVLESQDWRDRAAAARAIGQIAAAGPISSEATTQMLERLAATDVPEVQAAAQEALEVIQSHSQ